MHFFDDESSRFAAAIFDFVLFGIIYVATVFLSAVIGEDFIEGRPSKLLLLLSVSSIAFLLNKDSSGRSMGKSVFGLCIFNAKNGNPASQLQCFVRNLTLLIWPLELITILINPSRRLGDFIAGTKVVQCMSGINHSDHSRSKGILLFTFTLGVIYLVVIMFKR